MQNELYTLLTAEKSSMQKYIAASICRLPNNIIDGNEYSCVSQECCHFWSKSKLIIRKNILVLQVFYNLAYHDIYSIVLQTTEMSEISWYVL